MAVNSSGLKMIRKVSYAVGSGTRTVTTTTGNGGFHVPDITDAILRSLMGARSACLMPLFGRWWLTGWVPVERTKGSGPTLTTGCGWTNISAKWTCTRKLESLSWTSYGPWTNTTNETKTKNEPNGDNGR